MRRGRLNVPYVVDNFSMRISVKVKAGAKASKVEKLDDGSFLVHVKEKPQEGRANYAVREMLADYFSMPKSQVILLKGEKSKLKLFAIGSGN